MLALIKFLCNLSQQTERNSIKTPCLYLPLHLLNSLNIHEKVYLTFIAKSAEKLFPIKLDFTSLDFPSLSTRSMILFETKHFDSNWATSRELMNF